MQSKRPLKETWEHGKAFYFEFFQKQDIFILLL